MPELWDFYPLPYDDELNKIEAASQKESLQEWYEMASRDAANIKWN